jgi:hypothetical protein
MVMDLLFLNWLFVTGLIHHHQFFKILSALPILPLIWAKLGYLEPV